MTSSKSAGGMSIVCPSAEFTSDVSVNDRKERNGVTWTYWAYPPKIRSKKNMAISLINIFIIPDAPGQVITLLMRPP